MNNQSQRLVEYRKAITGNDQMVLTDDQKAQVAEIDRQIEDINNTIANITGIQSQGEFQPYSRDNETQNLKSIAALIREANSNGASVTELRQAVRDWIGDNEVTDHFIDQQLQKAKAYL